MPTQSSSLATATNFALALSNRRSRRILYVLHVHRDAGNIWRVSSIEDCLTQIKWYPELQQAALKVSILSDREKEVWDFSLAKSRTFKVPSQYIGTVYNRLLSENVRAIITDKSGRVQTPKVDDIVSLEFRPAIGTSQYFTPMPLFEGLVVKTVTTEPGR